MSRFVDCYRVQWLPCPDERLGVFEPEKENFSEPPLKHKNVKGIITEITVKAHKIPAYSTAVRVSFDSIDAAAMAVQDTLAVSPYGSSDESGEESVVLRSCPITCGFGCGRRCIFGSAIRRSDY